MDSLNQVKNWSNGKPIWSNGQYEITNARPANVLKGKDGKLYFVDVIAHSTEYLNKKNETTNGNQVKDKNDEVVDLSEGQRLHGMFMVTKVLLSGLSVGQ